MARLRSILAELIQRAMGGWRRERRSSADVRLAASVYAMPGPDIDREALFRIFGVIALRRKRRLGASGFFGKIFRLLSVSRKRGTDVLTSGAGTPAGTIGLRMAFSSMFRCSTTRAGPQPSCASCPRATLWLAMSCWLRSWRSSCSSQTRSRSPISSLSIVTGRNALVVWYPPPFYR